MVLVLVMICATPVATANIYTVETWETLPPGENVMESSPICWWEVAPLTLIWYTVFMFCPSFLFSGDFLYAAGAWCSLGFRQVMHYCVLGHPLRADIFYYIQVHPGTSFSVIVKKTGINRGTLYYHLRILLRVGKISELREGGCTTYFENSGKYSSDEKQILSRLQAGTAGEICTYLALCHSATRSEIAHRMDIAPSSVSWHLSRLKSSGIIVSEKVGRKTMYSLTSVAASLLSTCQSDIVRQQLDKISIIGSSSGTE